MNTIVALTDFSAASDNALRYAATIAQKTNASLSLLHMYQMPVTMNDVPVMLITADEIKKNADKRLNETKDELQTAYPGLTIQAESLLGDIVYEVQDWCEKHQPLAVVIGTHESSGAERFFFGSNANSIVRNITLPVFTVPDTYTDYRFGNAILATDLSHMEAFPSRKIISLLQPLETSLQVVHIDDKAPDQPITFPELVTLNPQYLWVQEAEDVNKRLLELVNQPTTDLFIVLPHEHNLVERLFFNLHTEKLIRHTSKPILSIKD
jgi:nucleotide-binding universal stress UspA family protein